MQFTDLNNIAISEILENAKMISEYVIFADYLSKLNVMQVHFGIYSLFTKTILQL